MGFHHVHFVFGLSMISYVFCVDPASIRPVPSSSFLSFAVELCQCLCLPALAPISWCTCFDAVGRLPFAPSRQPFPVWLYFRRLRLLCCFSF